MEETQESTPIHIHAAKWGAILAGIGIVLTVIYYAVDYTLLVNWKIGLISFAIYIGLTIYAGINYRTEIGGFIPYGKAFIHGFLVFAVSGLIASVFNLILYNLIDPELPGKLIEATIEKTSEMMRSFGTPEDKMDEALAAARQSAENQYTPFGVLKGYFFILIFSAVISLITSLFVRKNQPENL